MADTDYSMGAVIAFLDYAASKGLLNKATARNRKVAVERILDVATEDEKADVRNIDLENVFGRFMNLYSTEVKPSSMRIYKSRCESALEEFINWRDDPAGFRPKSRAKSSDKGVGKKVTKEKSNKEPEKEESEQEEVIEPSDGRGVIPTQTVYAPIYGGRSVMIQLKNLPYDLNKNESEKIKKMVTAILEGLIS